MKKFLLGLVLLLSTTFPLFGQATSGFHRTAVALARASSGVTAQVIPNAKITVTSTATGTAATIYSDPALGSQITPPVVTADNSGNYGYYISLGYCVTETITSPGQGTRVIPNICNNGAAVTSLNALTGTLSLTSSDSSVTITPSGSTINLQSGTVTVVGSGALTSTALVTGGGSTTVQTPAASATMDSSGNISTPGTITAEESVASTDSAIHAAAPPYSASCNWKSALGEMTAGSDILTWTLGTPFTSALVGKKVFVYGVGTGYSNLVTTVASYTDSTHVVLAASASETTFSEGGGGGPIWFGTSDDTAAIQAAESASLNESQQWSTQNWYYTTGPTNTIDLPQNATCAVSSTIWQPNGITLKGNGATLLQLADATAIAVDFATCANGTAPIGVCPAQSGYGYQFGGIENLSIYGPGPMASTNAGIRKEVVANFDERNLLVDGFKYGEENGEVQYSTTKNLTFQNNQVGRYQTTRATAPTKLTATAVTGSGGAYTVVANYAGSVDNFPSANGQIAISNCSGADFNANGGIYNISADSAGSVTFSSTAASLASNASSTCVGVLLPTGSTSLATLDNQDTNLVTKNNVSYGDWCQSCGFEQFSKTDSSYNGGANVVIGQQLAPFWYFTSSTASGGTCTPSSNLPITFSGGTFSFPVQAYIATNSGGAATGAFVIDGGYYTATSATPTMNVAGCSVQPTLPSLAMQNDAGLGIYSGANGQETINRGGLVFNEPKTDPGGAPGQPVSEPNRGYHVVIDGGVHGTEHGAVFDEFMVCPSPARAKIAFVANAKGPVVFSNPFCTSANLDFTANPASTFTIPGGGPDYTIFTTIGTDDLQLSLGPYSVVNTVPSGLVMDASGAPSYYRVGSADGQGIDGYEYGSGTKDSTGFRAVSPTTYTNADGGFSSRFYGEAYDEFHCGTSQTAIGAPYCAFGSGSSAADVSFSRTSAGVLTLQGYLAAKQITVTGTNPTFFNHVNSTNSGSTSGIPSSDNCLISYLANGTGSNYTETALCEDPGATYGYNGAWTFYRSTGTTLGSESFVFMGSLDGVGNFTSPSQITAAHYSGNTSTLTFTASTGAGTSPTIYVTGNDVDGLIQVTAGSTPAPASTIVDVTFGSPYTGTDSVSCVLTPESSAATTLQVYVTASTKTDFQVNAGPTALTATSIYGWFYHCAN